MKWDLDLWYELWDRAGSQGLDTWYDLRGEARDGPKTGRQAGDQRGREAGGILIGLGCKASVRDHAYGSSDMIRSRAGPTLGSAALSLLLFCEVASAIAGAGTVFFASVVAAWLVLPVVVGFKNVLDAGCFYMFVSLGIVVVVGTASHG